MLDKIYCNPVFRIGIICTPIGGKRLTFLQAKSVGKYFEGCKSQVNGIECADSIIEYSKDYVRFCDEHDITASITSEESKDRIRLSYQLTPIVRFPAFFIKLNNIEFIAREAITICTGTSDSKLWISLSLSDEDIELSQVEVLNHYNVFLDYVSNRIPAYKDFYSGIIRLLAKEQVKEFINFEDADKFQIEEHLSIIIISLETKIEIQELLEQSMKFGKEYLLNNSQLSDEYAKFFDNIFKLANNITGTNGTNDFSFFIQNSTPMDLESEYIVPIVVPDRHSLQRLALLLCFKDNKQTNVPREYYITIGSLDSQFNQRRYRNSAFCSRSIMKEVGRVY